MFELPVVDHVPQWSEDLIKEVMGVPAKVSAEPQKPGEGPLVGLEPGIAAGSPDMNGDSLPGVLGAIPAAPSSSREKPETATMAEADTDISEETTLAELARMPKLPAAHPSVPETAAEPVHRQLPWSHDLLHTCLLYTSPSPRD